MLKNILNLEGVQSLGKNDQKNIQGGKQEIGFPCESGTFMCQCNGFNRGCVSSWQVCYVMCGI
jgi:hypothetical protein